MIGTLATIAAALAALIAAALALRRWLLLVSVTGTSMVPGLSDGDLLVAWRVRRRRIGDIVVFRNPFPAGPGPDTLVKRVVAAEGDPVPDDLRAVVGADTVPAGQLLVRGDNPRSIDSRRLGYIPVEDLRAVVLFRLTEATR